jgi:integrase/recombinase XerD
MPDLEFYGEKFREHLLVLNFSRKTLETYGYGMRKFFRYLREMGILDLAALIPSDIRDYQLHLVEEVNAKGVPNSVCTNNGGLQAVKTFFRVMRQEGYLVGEPSRDIPFAKVPQRLPRSILTKEEMRKLLEAPDIQTAIGYRDRAILEVLYSTGLRNSEVLALKLHDVDTQEGYLRVNEGKGGKDRVVPLGRLAGKYVENYVKAVRPQLLKDPACPFLFLNQYGERMGKCGLLELVHKYRRKAGLEKRVTPHTFRHTCATLMMKNKANLRHVQELLGHGSLETTQVYTAVSIVDLKEAHKKFHPRERERGTA